MKNKIIVISIFVLFLGIMCSSVCFAKYKLGQELSMQVYIDKTPPSITIKSNDNNGTYTKTDLNNVIENNCEITVTTKDNIMIKQNEYIYNPTIKDFNNITPKKFESGKTLTEDGYYKITSIDTSGNKTEIVILIDKTPPKVDVHFYKKGTVSKANTQIIGGETRNLASSKEIETTNNKKINIVGGKTRNLLAVGNGASIEVFNESDLRNAINNKYSSIIIRNSIACSNPININYDVKITPISADNAISYSGYNTFITIQNGGILTLQSIVVDTRGAASGHNVTSINIQSGGMIVFKESSIVDGGSGNIGMIINSGAVAQIHSCHFAYADKGIVVKDNGVLSFYNTEGGRTSEFWNNGTAISFEDFTGTANFNQSNIRIRNNTNGIVVGNCTGTINLSSYNVYGNQTGINFGGGTLNIAGGIIYENTTGIYTNPSYSGRMTITNVNLHSNTQYAINHSKNEDSSCNIYGGTIRGKIYLGQRDNYINTNDKYPTLEVIPSQYFFKRKLAKTASNACAKTEISKITLTPKDSWYKYVDSEYIVLWTGGNVFVRYKDYYGNILKEDFKNGTIGSNYSITPPTISGYDLIYTPANANGKYTQNDIVVDFKYDIVNVAKVTFEDLLSGVVSAKYWYNSSSQNFSGNGSNFSNGTVFENYGYYKIVVTNKVGLQKTLTFTLNKNSFVR